MENNFNETINLGNNVTSGLENNVTSGLAQNLNQQEAVEPIYGQTTTTGTNETITINVPAQQLGQVQNMHSQVVNNLETGDINITVASEGDYAVASAPVTPPTDENIVVTPVNELRESFIVPTYILKNLVSNARKVGTYNQIQVQSQVIDLELNDKGIKVIASNGNIDYECLNTDVRFKNSFRTCIDKVTFGDFVNTFDTTDFTEVELKYDDATGILTVVTPTDGNFYFPKRIDLGTQQTIKLELTYPIPYAEMTSIDCEQFISAIVQSKPGREFPTTSGDLKGTFFSNLIISTDKLAVYMQDNQDILKTQQFFVGSDLCDLLSSVDFNANKFRIGFITDSSNDIRAINISDEKTTICGIVEPEADIDMSLCNTFWSSGFTNKIKIDTRKFVNSLKRVSVFLLPDEDDCHNFEFDNNILRIVLVNGKAKEAITVANNINYSGKVILPIRRLLKVFGNVKVDSFNFCIDSSIDNCICLDFGDYKWVIATGK